MKHLHTFESLPYDEIDELGDFFFEILKKKPELYKKYVKDLKNSKTTGEYVTFDWFKHGLTMRFLKKLSHGVPSAGQAAYAEKYALRKYRKWLKENPAFASAKIVNLNNKTGIFESTLF